ncbi:proteasome accessory factor PafA2 family protein [Fimbriimonas ginsengisoli]|uniref:Pup ligase PafA n=1 Tax=Fimbriimonas ginsengisoli Gsoil 348 TaxID=661478 RepID=A0A068NVG2_FIMGI|nr:proteasome accessory factor PafA2 family protein [Fimbriimonas ginsengisoli]AIE86775.1 Pup ligase PafA [Fimbriimonas ginsengisoli Gsoil 348]
MPRQTGDRIFGVETEFGCLVSDDTLGTPESAVELVKDYLFHELKLGAIDLHARDDVFEPAQSGGFLMNGARLYIDAVGSHLEYATAECRHLKDLVANDRAGQRQIVRAIKELGLDDALFVYNNSVDHFGGHTFGCHENYLVRGDDEFLNTSVQMLYPFLVTRQIFSGVGRVGGHILTAGGLRPSYQEVMENPVDYIWVSHVYSVVPDDRVPFQLSQRADHIIKTIASRVRFNRALINPKWEHFYSHDGMTRLHLLFGESNQNEFAYALKVGTTVLVLRLLEEHRVPERLTLAQPLIALREVSRDQDFKWIVSLAEGGSVRSVDLQREYLRLAEVYRGESTQTDWILDNWRQVLDDLEKDPMAMEDRIDWVAKRKIVEEYMSEEGVGWNDDALHSVDLEYHNIDPERSLFYGLQEMGRTKRILDDLDITMAMTDPPQNTRAKGRAALVEQVLSRKNPRFYLFDWNGVALDRHTYVEMPNPFETYENVGK